MNPFATALAGFILAVGIVAMWLGPALAVTAGSLAAMNSPPTLTYVACRRTYHCHTEIKDDGRKVRRCHVCG